MKLNNKEGNPCFLRASRTAVGVLFSKKKSACEFGILSVNV
jgi:hypothetical protein